jgi:hypothetical protein
VRCLRTIPPLSVPVREHPATTCPYLRGFPPLLVPVRGRPHHYFSLFADDPTTDECPCSRAISPLCVPVREQPHHHVSLFASNLTTDECPCSRTIPPLSVLGKETIPDRLRPPCGMARRHRANGRWVDIRSRYEKTGALWCVSPGNIGLASVPALT